MSATLTITRGELVAIIDSASKECSKRTRAKLRAVAETTDAVAVGWFHCDGVGCPIRQAGEPPRTRSFEKAFDRAMWARFNRTPDEIFVVQVV